MKLGECIRRYAAAALVLSANTTCSADAKPQHALLIQSSKPEIATAPTQEMLPPSIRQFLKIPGILEWRTNLELPQQVSIINCRDEDPRFQNMQGIVTEPLGLKTRTLPDSASPLGHESTWFRRKDEVRWKLEVVVETPIENTKQLERWALVETPMQILNEKPPFLFSLIQQQTIRSGISGSETEPITTTPILPTVICSRQEYSWD